MRRRLYFLLPDVASTRQVVDDLLVARIEARRLHVLARRDMDLQDLPEASVLQKTDVVHGAQIGARAGRCGRWHRRRSAGGLSAERLQHAAGHRVDRCAARCAVRRVGSESGGRIGPQFQAETVPALDRSRTAAARWSMFRSTTANVSASSSRDAIQRPSQEEQNRRSPLSPEDHIAHAERRRPRFTRGRFFVAHGQARRSCRACSHFRSAKGRAPPAV